MRKASGVPETPVVNCVLLWARPGMEAALSAYEDKVLSLVAEHGGRVVERGTVLPGSQHEGEPPTEVQLLEMPSEASLNAYVNDPRRLALAAERDAAIARTDLFRLQPASSRLGSNLAGMTDNDPAGPAPGEDEPDPDLGADDPGYLTQTGEAVGEDGSVVPIIGGLPAVEGSAWDIGAATSERGANLAEEEHRRHPHHAADEDSSSQ
jgi:uncharacterized protein (DUF1330 family)